MNLEPSDDELSHDKLSFPFTPPRSWGDLVDVAPGIKWFRQPMPYSLNHVNVYLLQGDEGWLILDTGLDSPKTRGIWEDLFSGPLKGEKVIGVYSTHHHIDHIGLAGYLTERLRVPLYMTFKEYFSLRGWPANLKEVPWQHVDLCHKIGLPKAICEQSLVLYDFNDVISTPPLSFRQLKDGAALPVLGGDWRVMVGEGHAPELAMLYSAQQKILISGDQLLPRISSNVSVSPVNPDDEPLSAWFNSLDRLAEIPDDVLVLPGHGLPFRSAKRRVAELREHHDQRIKFILDNCAVRGFSVFELMQAMYPEPLNDFNMQLALGEAMAHVNYLLANSRLLGNVNSDGVLLLTTALSH